MEGAGAKAGVKIALMGLQMLESGAEVRYVRECNEWVLTVFIFMEIELIILYGKLTMQGPTW